MTGAGQCPAPHPELPGAAAPSHRDTWLHPAVLIHPPCPHTRSLWQEQCRCHRAWGRLCHRHRLPCGAGIHHPAALDLFISRRFWCDNVPHLAARALSHCALSHCLGKIQRRCQCCHEEGGWGPPALFGALLQHVRAGGTVSPLQCVPGASRCPVPWGTPVPQGPLAAPAPGGAQRVRGVRSYLR